MFRRNMFLTAYRGSAIRETGKCGHSGITFNRESHRRSVFIVQRVARVRGSLFLSVSFPMQRGESDILQPAIISGQQWSSGT